MTGPSGKNRQIASLIPARLMVRFDVRDAHLNSIALSENEIACALENAEREAHETNKESAPSTSAAADGPAEDKGLLPRVPAGPHGARDDR